MALKSGGGAPPVPGTIFEPSAGALNGNDNNYNNALRVVCILAGPSAGKVKVTFQASDVALILRRATFGKRSGAASATTATPLPLLFSGVGNVTIPANTSLTTDALDVSALSLLTSDACVVSYDCGGDGGTKFRAGNNNAETYYKIDAQEANNASPSGMILVDGANIGSSFAVAKIETEA